MYKYSYYFLLPLLLLNITTSANRWELLPGILLGQFIFWVILFLSLIINYRTPYRTTSIYLFLFGLVFGIFQVKFQSNVFEILKTISFGLLLMIVGATVYGKKPTFLSNQLVLFLSLCIPIMILQITGANSFFMVWNTEYGHDPLILSPEDYGKFNLIPVYPTIFLNAQDINYQIGQGRPCGLLDSNNVLSIFIAITNTVIFFLAKNSKIKLRNIIVAITLTLSMSLEQFEVCLNKINKTNYDNYNNCIVKYINLKLYELIINHNNGYRYIYFT